MSQQSILYIINVDWYFLLHWIDRAISAQDDGYIVSIATKITSQENKEKILSLGFSLYEIDLERKNIAIAKELSTLRQIYNLISTLKPTLIHSITMKANIYSSLSLIMKKPLLVATMPGLGILGHEHDKPSWNILTKVALFTYASILSMRCKAITFENKYDMALIKRMIFTKKTILTLFPGSGVNIDDFKYSNESDEGQFIVLFGGRLLRSKGLLELIRAVKIVRRSHENVELYVAGIEDLDARDRIPLDYIIDQNNLGNIKWLGACENMPEIISHANVICLPTRYGEGLPRILLEANACGKPVISTKNNGCIDYIEDGRNGLYCSNSPNDIAAKIIFLLKNPMLRKKMGAYGSEKIRSEYSSEIVTNKNLTLYKKILENQNEHSSKA